jgi:hypothetical protein
MRYFRLMRFSQPILCLAIAGVLAAPLSIAHASGAPIDVVLRGSVMDEDGKPVPLLEVTIQTVGAEDQILHTTAAGTFEYSGSIGDQARISFNKTGFFRVTELPLALKEGINEISFTVNHETEIHEEVEVYSSSDAISPLVTSHSETLSSRYPGIEYTRPAELR